MWETTADCRKETFFSVLSPNHLDPDIRANKGKKHHDKGIEKDLRLLIRKHYFTGFIGKIGGFSLRIKSYLSQIYLFDLFSLLLPIQSYQRCNV